MSALELAVPKHTSTQKVTKISHKDTAQPHGLAITHKEEEVALILSLAVGFATWDLFR